MGDSDTQPGLAPAFERFSRFGAGIVGVLGAIVLAGWALDVPALTTIWPGWASMKANTALCFLLSGIALLTATRPQPGTGWSKLPIFLAASVAVIGLLTLIEYQLGVDLAIDQMVFADHDIAPLSSAPGRMAPATALGFVLTGLAVASLDVRQSAVLSQIAALFGLLIGILAILGYAYGVSALYGIGAYSSVAIHTAISFVIINLASLLSRPRRGLCAIVASDTAGGVMARRLLPLAFVAPFAIGWVQTVNDDLALVNPRFGAALASLTYLLIFSTVFWFTARRLHDSEQIRMNAQNAQHRQQAQLAGIIESAMDGIIMVNDAQRITLFNPAAEKIFGHRAADVLGTPLDILIPPSYRQKHAVHFCAFGATGETNRQMGELSGIIGLRANGDEFPVEASISRLEAIGTKLSIIILRDISERQRFEQALIESRRQLSAMIEQAPISIAQFDCDMRYLATSRRWAADYDGNARDLRGKSHYDVVPDISDYWRKVHRDGLNGITTTNDSDLWVKADGSRRWLRWSVHPWVDERGSIGGIIISSEDITRQKLVELALRASEDDLNRAQAVGNIGNWRLDVQRNELTWSSQNYRIFGLPDGTQLTYQTFLDRVHPDDREYIDSMWKAALSGAPYDIEHRLVVGNEVKWVREKAELEFDRNGCVVSGFGITQDITAQRRAEEQAKAANERLAAVAAERAASLRELSSALLNAEERERDRLYELLHDNVQPQLVASRLALSGLGPQMSKDDMLRVIAETKEQISSVIQTARTLSIELNPPLIRDRGLIPALESLCRWVLVNYGISVDLDCAEGTEPGDLTIRLLCFKAVRELLMNVVKYAEIEYAKIRLESLNGNTLLISVQDEGVGFDPSTSQLGSGLSNIEHRLGMVGGSVTIESALGKGTRVTLQVPLEQHPQDQSTGNGDAPSSLDAPAVSPQELKYRFGQEEIQQ